MRGDIQGLYALLDLPHGGGLTPAAAAGALAAGGASVLQLRAKTLSTAQRIECLGAVAPLARERGVPVIVNDDMEAALAGIDGVAGVHLGQEDLARYGAERLRAARRAGLWVGISTHTVDQVAQAMELAPDYIGFGPVFATTSKPDADGVVGLHGLAQACDRATCPVVAIGGIDELRASACLAAGAHAAAVISALVAGTAAQVEARARALARRLAEPN